MQRHRICWLGISIFRFMHSNFKKLGFVLIHIITIALNAQNLVPNPGFESVTSNFTCGIFSSTDLATSVNNWYSPTQATPDAYSTAIAQSCYNFMPNSTYAGPISLKGPQLPRNGSTMVGVYCYSIPGLNQREYIQAQLISPLQVNETYAVSFYVNLPNRQELCTDRIGAYLSVGAVGSSNDQPLNYTPQVAAPGIITDTLNWVLVTDTIVATSAFDYITIGNFYNDANTPTISNPGGTSGPGNYGAYYFIDDVSILHIEPKGVGEILQESSALNVVSQNGITTVLFTNEPYGSESNRQLEIEIFDLLGRSVYRRSYEISPGLNVLELTDLTVTGVYLLTAKRNSTIFTRRFVGSN